MSWIDEAEKRQKELVKEKVKEEIIHQINMEENFKNFRDFIDRLNQFLNRVNELPFEERNPSLELGFTEVEENKCYEFYGSAYILKKSLFALFTGAQYKVLCWRRVNFKIAEQKNIVKAHIYENITEKNKGVSHKKSESKDKYKLKINGFSEELLNRTIDWLTFKCTNHDFKKILPFAPPSKNHHH
ncbi:MAG: hypothetical protein HY958_11895 [Bacteroidia bacterium]|nr:hypothetical protein [Bacteroidia bacterium]